MDKTQNLEEAFNQLFKGGSTSTGEEELLRLASKYSMQLSARQIKALLFLQFKAQQFEYFDLVNESKIIQNFIVKWLEWKEFNNSAGFIMRVIGDISMRRFITESAFKVNVQK